MGWKWHVAAGTFDGTRVRLYIDGVEVGTGTPTTLKIGYGLSSGDGGSLGVYRGTCDLTLRGDVDEVTIWSRALPVSEIWTVLRRFVPFR